MADFCLTRNVERSGIAVVLMARHNPKFAPGGRTDGELGVDRVRMVGSPPHPPVRHGGVRAAPGSGVPRGRGVRPDHRSAGPPPGAVHRLGRGRAPAAGGLAPAAGRYDPRSFPRVRPDWAVRPGAVGARVLTRALPASPVSRADFVAWVQRWKCRSMGKHHVIDYDSFLPRLVAGL